MNLFTSLPASFLKRSWAASYVVFICVVCKAELNGRDCDLFNLCLFLPVVNQELCMEVSKNFPTRYLVIIKVV